MSVTENVQNFPRPLALRQGRATQTHTGVIDYNPSRSWQPLLAQSHWSLRSERTLYTAGIFIYPWKRTSSEANRQLTRLRPLSQSQLAM
jgi:hypothetical protein